jgi:NH3-dependent NAD+ synthetase
MFISKQEKEAIQKNLKDMASVIASTLVDITVLKAKIKALEAKQKNVAESSKKDIADEDRRARQRMYARRYYAKKKLTDKQKGNENVSS